MIVKNHSAFRKYYIAKNIIYMARKRKSYLMLGKGILQEVKLIAIVVLYEDDSIIGGGIITAALPSSL